MGALWAGRLTEGVGSLHIFLLLTLCLPALEQRSARILSAPQVGQSVRVRFSPPEPLHRAAGTTEEKGVEGTLEKSA